MVECIVTIIDTGRVMRMSMDEYILWFFDAPHHLVDRRLLNN